ncbi:MAG TPA: 4-hydroxythreonine-4-phosphate dehydrogenase PdxA [Acetobacteraceae bacterium]|nr:4-hydroxythreonine-4-phosphate dehydrogenase PdxA [Acetobacteraceae bacterium]
MPANPPRLAITMGDPAGVGPEIIVKACARLMPRLQSGEMRLLVIGHRSALRASCDLLQSGLSFPETGRDADFPPLALLPAGEELAPIRFGELTPEAGRFAYLAVETAVALAQAGRIDAIVTAPLNKEALNRAGYHYAGHTDMLAALTHTRSSVMLLAHGDMRVSHVTTHVALEKVPALLTPERLRRTIDLTHAALLDLGIARPRIAVAALNPHAGEGGLFGTQDITVTTPVVAQCLAEGLAVTGPVPGDTVFVKLRARQFDAVVAMYHDQGHIPVKLLGFQVDPATGAWQALSGVNVTLGLPVIRTSVDHGTAFDIAGKGVANEDSLLEAVDYALRLASNRTAV